MLDKGKERMAENAGAVVTDKRKEETTATPNFEGWVRSINFTLGSVKINTVKACSISIVPEHIRKLKVEAYMPKVVSIGPLHRQTRTDLVYMKEIKWRCMWYLLHRTKDHRTKDLTESVKICSGKLIDLDDLVRASYNAGDIKFNSYDLAKIMLLDGCFLLELLISNDKVLDTEFPCSLQNGPGIKVGKREDVLADLTVLVKDGKWEDVLADLTVLENQIPLFILNVLFRKLFRDDVYKDEDKDTVNIKKAALSLLGYSASSVPKAHHFLELVHSFIIETADNEEGNGYVAIDVETSAEVKDDSRVKLKRCATRLQAAGVTIKPTNAEINPAPAEIRFDLDIKFSKSSRELTIPPLHITETTEVKWRNFIVWELNRSDRAKFIHKVGRTRVICKFIWYALFFQGLICSIHDIQLLRDEKVIVVHDAKGSKQGEKMKTMNNEDLLNLFHEITEGVDDFQIDVDPWFCWLFGELNTYQSANRATQARRVSWHFCRCVLTGTWFKSRNAYRALRREYIPTGWKLVAVLAAVVGLGLTAAQTGLAVRFH